MKPSSSALIGAIARTLEEEVLSDLEPASWTASRLRSCLMMLKHLEQRVGVEGPLLYRENADLQDLLSELAAALHDQAWATGLEAESRELARGAADLPYPSIEALAEVNEGYQGLIDRVIREIHEHRPALGDIRFSALNGRILRCLREIKSREALLIDAAAGYSPI